MNDHEHQWCLYMIVWAERREQHRCMVCLATESRPIEDLQSYIEESLRDNQDH